MMHIRVELFSPVTVTEFDEYRLKLGRLRKISHDLNLSHTN